MTRNQTHVVLASCLTQILAIAAPAQTSPYRLTRYSEDWSFLKNDTTRHSPLDPLKYIPLDANGSSYLSLGGETRLTYEFYDNNAFGAGPQDNDGYILQRYMLHADLHLGPHFRSFVDVKSTLEDGRTGGPRPVDTDVIDLHQAFIDLSTGPSESFALTFRPGRQEMLYGSARLISNRHGPNTRLSFDALRLLSKAGPWSIDGFFARPVETDPGAFDDDTEDDRSLWGVYATLPPKPGATGLDLYYLGYRNEQAVFEQGAGRETRHTLGSRAFGRVNQFDYNYELFGQFGEFDGDQIRAWSLGTDTGYTLANSTFEPRLGIKANIISGDSDPDDNTLGTFNALFPRGGYFGEIGVLGPANLINLHPSVDLNLTKKLILTADTVFFWRYSTDDALYNPNGNIIRRDTNSDSRYIGTQPSLILTYRPTEQLTAIATYTLFLPGEFIDNTGPNDTISFFRLEVNFRF